MLYLLLVLSLTIGGCSIYNTKGMGSIDSDGEYYTAKDTHFVLHHGDVACKGSCRSTK